MKKDVYEYPAIFYKDEDGYFVMFPDLRDCVALGKTYDEAYKKAKNFLCEYLEAFYDRSEPPKPTDVSKLLKANPNEGEDWIIVSISVNIKKYLDEILLERKEEEIED